MNEAMERQDANVVNPSDDFDAVAYINAPRWQKVSLGLDRIEELLRGLGSPHKNLKFVHVAGTNGKGSTCSYVASVLEQAGYKVGLFTSPYLICFEERIRVNGENISSADLDRVTRRVRRVAESMDEHPTEFELMTAVAFLHFAQQGCDIVVAEVGLGGRLDSTNVIEWPEVCVITRIGIDHVAVLGDTLAQIAGEKAGIIKGGASVVSWPQEQEAQEVIEEISDEKGAFLTTVSLDTLQVLPVERLSGGGMIRPFMYDGVCYATRLLGSYQPANAVVAIEACRVLAKKGWHVSESDIASGIAKTEWPGRFQVVASSPDFVVDGGHNAQGARALADSLKDVFPGRKAVFVVGILADKEHETMLTEVLPLAQAVVALTPPNPRALPADELVLEINRIRPDVAAEVANSIPDAIGRARDIATESGLVVAFGSLYSIGDVMSAL